VYHRFTTFQRLLITLIIFIALIAALFVAVWRLQPQVIYTLLYTATPMPTGTATATIEPSITPSRVVLPVTWTPRPSPSQVGFTLQPSTDPATILTPTVDTSTLQAIIHGPSGDFEPALISSETPDQSGE
jgi:hypothetical protein